MPKILAFDIWGNYAHYKKIFVTTSALSYAIPSKTSIYGYVGAVIGLDKSDGRYLQSFSPGRCKIGLQVQNEIVMQRISTNLHPHTQGMVKSSQTRKPTTIEYVYKPRYRIYFWHAEEPIYQKLKVSLMSHQAVYTPCLGLANLISNFEWLGEYDAIPVENNNRAVPINSVIPRSYFEAFDTNGLWGNEIIEYSQYAVEMNEEREVTKRDDVFFDRQGKAISAFVNLSYTFQHDDKQAHIVLF